MKPFMDKDFLLDTPTARHLYHDFAAAMPIIDYHCHLIPTISRRPCPSSTTTAI